MPGPGEFREPAAEPRRSRFRVATGILAPAVSECADTSAADRVGASGEQLSYRHFPAWDGVSQIQCVGAAVRPCFTRAAIDSCGAPRRIENEDGEAACPKPVERLFLYFAKAVVGRDDFYREVRRLRPVLHGSSDRVGVVFGHERRVGRTNGVRIASEHKASLGAERHTACGLAHVRPQEDAYGRCDSTVLSSGWRHHTQLTPDELSSEPVVWQLPKLIDGLCSSLDGHPMRLPRRDAIHERVAERIHPSTLHTAADIASALVRSSPQRYLAGSCVHLRAGASLLPISAARGLVGDGKPRDAASAAPRREHPSAAIASRA